MTKTTVLGTCPQDCPDACSMLIDVEDGRAIGVRGNPDHPFTRGGLCLKVNNYEERTYSPERVLTPLKRSGPKGSGQFEPITWDAAMGKIATRWNAIIDEFGSEAILPHSFLGAMGVLNGLSSGDAFFNRLGASIAERTYCGSGSSTGYIMTVGATPGTDPETIVHSKYIVLWATNTISTNLHLWPFIAEARKNGAKVVVIDPIRTRTAKKADWHLPIKPGTDGALAMAMIQVIIEENLVDDDYVANHTLGYDELAERAAEYPPEAVADTIGVPAADIRTLAREFAAAQPAVIRPGVAIERHPGGGQTMRAITCLPALVGAWRQIGGGMIAMPEFAFPIKQDALMRPDWIRPGTRVINQWRLGRALTGELALDPPIKSLVVYNANPVLVVPEQEKVLAGLVRDDLFTVVHEQFLTDTARYADLVLPATTQLEQFDLVASWGQYYFSINEPAIAPLGEAVPNTEFFRRLAGAMGFDDAHFARSDAETLGAVVDWDDPKMAGITLEGLRKTGFAKLTTPEAWGDAPHGEGNFPTPSGKCELRASLAENGDFVLAGLRQGSEEHQSGEPVDPLPHFIAPGESNDPERRARYPLNIVSPKSHAFINSSFGNLPQQRHHAGEKQILMIHPDDATARNIGEGSTVRVFNDRGSFVAVAQVNDDLRTGLVCAPMGYWRNASPNGEDGRTVAAVHSATYADMGRAPTFSDSLVEVEVDE